MEHVAMYARKKREGSNNNVEKTALTPDEYQGLLELKEERKRNEKRIIPLYRNIGFTVSLLLVIVAFNWNFPVETIVDLGEVEEVAEEIIEIPISEQLPPPPPKASEVFHIVEVPNTEVVEETEIVLDVEVTEETSVAEVIVHVAEEVEKEVVEEIFTVVEEYPEPVGGFKAFNSYLAEHISYPRTAAKMGVSGKVFVQFVVEKDGKLTDIQVVKGIGAGCDEEAVRVVSEAPNWKPGKQRGVPVRVRKTVPIYFILKES